MWEHKNFKHIRLAHKIIYLSKEVFDIGRLRMIYGNHIYISKIKKLKKLYQFYDEYNQRFLFNGIKPVEEL